MGEGERGRHERLARRLLARAGGATDNPATTHCSTARPCIREVGKNGGNGSMTRRRREALFCGVLAWSWSCLSPFVGAVAPVKGQGNTGPLRAFFY